MLDLGTIIPGTTIHLPFHTFDSNDPSASVTITGLAVADIAVYKDGGNTARASTAGFALLGADGIDEFGGAGLHGISVDLADNTTANFYEAGSQYFVRIADVTVDAATIRFFVARFRIGYPGALLDTTIATLASQTSFTLEDGSLDANAYNGCIAYIHDLASAVQVAIGVVSAYDVTTKTVTLSVDPAVFTMVAGDNISLFPPALLPTVAGRTLDVAVTGEAGLDLGNVVGVLGNANVGWVDGSDQVSVASLAAAALTAIEDEIWDALKSGHAVANSFGDFLDIEVSSRLAPTVAGRTLDIAATGEASPDFNNILGTLDAADIGANAFTAAKFAANSLDGKGDWNIGKTGYSLAATGLDAISSTALGMIEIAKAVWDRVLTGATHNIVNSAGRIVRFLREAGGYSGGAIYIDTNNGVAGTTDFENGTDSNPSLTLADANTLATSRGISTFVIAPRSSLTFVAAQENQSFIGESWVLALGGQSISGSHFRGAEVSGIGTGANESHFEHCEMGTCTLAKTHLDFCDIEAIITLSAVDNKINDCYHSGGTSTIDVGVAVVNSTLHLHHYHGAITIENMGQAGTDVLHWSSPDGKLTLAASCIGGTVNMPGTFDFVNNGSGMTLNRGGDVVNDVSKTALASICTEPRLSELDEATAGKMANQVDLVKTEADKITLVDAGAGVAGSVIEEVENRATPADLGAPQINQAFSDIPFLLVDSTDHVTPETGLTPTGERSLNGGAFAAVSGAIAEVANGIYQFDALAADMNGVTVVFRFSDAAADDSFVFIKTRA